MSNTTVRVPTEAATSLPQFLSPRRESFLNEDRNSPTLAKRSHYRQVTPRLVVIFFSRSLSLPYNDETKSTSFRSSHPFHGISKLPSSNNTVDPSVPDHLQKHVPNGIHNDCTTPPLFLQKACNHLQSR